MPYLPPAACSHSLFYASFNTIRTCRKLCQQAESAELHPPKRTRKIASCWASAPEQVGAGPSKHKNSKRGPSSQQGDQPRLPHSHSCVTLLTSRSDEQHSWHTGRAEVRVQGRDHPSQSSKLLDELNLLHPLVSVVAQPGLAPRKNTASSFSDVLCFCSSIKQR